MTVEVVTHPGDLCLVAHQAVEPDVWGGHDALDQRACLFRSTQRGTPDAEMQAGQIHRHVDFETQGQAHPVTQGYSLYLLNVFEAIDHQRDVCACCHCPGDGGDVLLVPGGITDEQVIESL